MNRRAALTLLPAVTVLALLLRLHNVSTHDWHYDEAFHVYAAESLLDSGTLTLPSGREYRRGLVATYGAATMFQAFGVSRLTARLPAVVWGSLTVLAIWILGQHYVGSRAALLAAGLYALCPFAVASSRYARYYADVQFFYTVAFLIVGMWLARERRVREVMQLLLRATPLRWVRWLVTLALLIVAQYLAYNGNAITLIGVAVVGLFVTLRFLRRLSTSPLRETARWLDTWLVLAGIVVAAALALTNVGYLKRLYWIAVAPPLAASGHLYYLKLFLADYPLATLLIPAGAYSIIRRHRWQGLYLVAGLVFPLAIMSAVLENRLDRYAVHLLPVFALLLASGIAVTASIAADVAARLRASRRSLLLVGGLTLGIYVLNAPWVSRLGQVLDGNPGVYEGFRVAPFEQLTTCFSPGQRVIVANSTLVISRYLGKPVHFVLTEGGRDVVAHYSGAERLTSPEDLIAAARRHAEGVIVLSSEEYASRTILSANMIGTIQQVANTIDPHSCPGLILAYWGLIHNPTRSSEHDHGVPTVRR